MEYKTTRQILPSISYSVLIWFSIFNTTFIISLAVQFIPQFEESVVLLVSVGFIFLLSLIPFFLKKHTDIFNAKCCVCRKSIYEQGPFYYKNGSRFFCYEDGQFVGLTEPYILPSLYERVFLNDLTLEKKHKYMNGGVVNHTALDLKYAKVTNILVGKYKRVCQRVDLFPEKLQDNQKNMGIVLLTDKETLEQEIVIVNDLKSYMAKKQKDNHVRLMVECAVTHLQFWEAYFIEMFDTYDNGKNEDSGAYEYFSKNEVRIIQNSRRATK